MAHVAANPAEALALLPRKLGNLLALEGNELAYLYATGHFGDRSGAIVWRWGLATLPRSRSLSPWDWLDWRSATTAAGYPPPAVSFLGAAVALSLVAFGEPRFHLPFVPVLAVLATGLAGWRAGVHRWRAIAVPCLVAVPGRRVVGASFANYLPFLRLMAEPDGWRRQLFVPRRPAVTPRGGGRRRKARRTSRGAWPTIAPGHA